MRIPGNEKGFTLVEALVATMVLAIGILSLMTMQSRAVSANASAFSRTSAGGVAIAVLETLKELDFSDTRLSATHPTLAAMPNPPSNNDWNNTVWNDANLRPMTAATLAAVPMLANEFQMSGANQLTSRVVGAGATSSAGSHAYRLGWAVVDNVTGTNVPSKTIRVYLAWPGAMGASAAIFTTVKYNNS